VRLRECVFGEVKVHSSKVREDRGIRNINCGMATCRGEQMGRNGQSVTTTLLSEGKVNSCGLCLGRAYWVMVKSEAVLDRS